MVLIVTYSYFLLNLSWFDILVIKLFFKGSIGFPQLTLEKDQALLLLQHCHLINALKFSLDQLFGMMLLFLLNLDHQKIAGREILMLQLLEEFVRIHFPMLKMLGKFQVKIVLLLMISSMVQFIYLFIKILFIFSHSFSSFTYRF